MKAVKSFPNVHVVRRGVSLAFLTLQFVTLLLKNHGLLEGHVSWSMRPPLLLVLTKRVLLQHDQLLERVETLRLHKLQQLSLRK